jgi:hypothetical protein
MLADAEVKFNFDRRLRAGDGLIERKDRSVVAEIGVTEAIEITPRSSGNFADNGPSGRVWNVVLIEVQDGES